MTTHVSSEPEVRETRVTEQLPARPRRRRRGGWVSLLAILAVLAAIVVVGDRVAAKYATDELRTQLVAELNNRGVESSTTQVGIGGFPFLTQVAKGRYDQITIDMTEVRLPAGGRRVVTLPTLNVVASGVAADTAEVVQGTARVVADQVTGEALVSFDTLETLVDYRRYSLTNVTFAESAGGLRVTATANVVGTEVPISATAEVTSSDGAISVKLRNAQAVGIEAPPAVRDYLGELVQNTLAAQLPQLPFGLALDEVDVRAEGLAISATGNNVPLLS